MNEILLIAGMTLVTFVVRYPVLALVGKIPLSEGVLRALRYVPPSVLAAIILPAMIYNSNGAFAISAENTYLLAGILSFIVAWWTKNTLITIVVGMALLLGLKAALGQF
jgi:branched-subunit amino acid transport protein